MEWVRSRCAQLRAVTCCSAAPSVGCAALTAPQGGNSGGRMVFRQRPFQISFLGIKWTVISLAWRKLTLCNGFLSFIFHLPFVIGFSAGLIGNDNCEMENDKWKLCFSSATVGSQSLRLSDLINIWL